MSESPCRIGVLVSGGGTNLQSIIDQVHLGECTASIECVISNVADVYALTRAQQANIPQQVISHKDYTSRQAFETALIGALHAHDVNLVVLAGFMRILEKTFIDQFPGRILNIHPSLLPKYPGLHTHQQALENGDELHGCSVHFATAELDGGPVIIQASVPVLADDDASSLAARVLEKEHVIYPRCVQWLCEGEIHYSQGEAFHQGNVLTQPMRLDDVR